MSKSDIAVSVRGVSKSYTIAHNQEQHVTLAEAALARLKNPMHRPQKETFWALKDIDFDIKKGDVVGIIGRNGAGKSTLLKILSRITEPTTGRIDLYGRVGSLLEVGTGFHPELTGRENVYLNGAILGMNKAEIKKQFDAIVDFSGVEQFLDTPVKRYSSGMYVRLAFAVAAHLNPEILIIDEVLAVGDAQFQNKCLGKMKEISEADGKTVLFVSHNLSAVRQLCTRALLLSAGRVEFSGPTISVADRYLSLTFSGAERRFESRARTTGFLAVQMVDCNGSPMGVVPPEVPAFVELHLKVSEGFGLTAGFTIFNQENVALIVSRLADSGIELGLGKHLFRVAIPVELLAPGRYRIEGAVWDAEKVYHQDQNLHQFDIMPSIGHDRHGRWSAAYLVSRSVWLNSAFEPNAIELNK